MSYELEGKLHKVFEIVSKTESFQTREFVVQTDGQYPQFVKFQLTQDRCSVIDPHKEGEMIKVFFDLRGREWNEKYFTNLNAWRVEKKQEEQAAPGGSFPEESGDFATTETSGDSSMAAEDFDDLPF